MPAVLAYFWIDVLLLMVALNGLIVRGISIVPAPLRFICMTLTRFTLEALRRVVPRRACPLLASRSLRGPRTRLRPSRLCKKSCAVAGKRSTVRDLAYGGGA